MHACMHACMYAHIYTYIHTYMLLHYVMLWYITWRYCLTNYGCDIHVYGDLPVVSPTTSSDKPLNCVYIYIYIHNSCNIAGALAASAYPGCDIICIYIYIYAYICIYVYIYIHTLIIIITIMILLLLIIIIIVVIIVIIVTIICPWRCSTSDIIILSLSSNNNTTYGCTDPIIELRYSYPYPCPNKFYKLPAGLCCYTNDQICYTNCLGHGHGYECHSPAMHLAWRETSVYLAFAEKVLRRRKLVGIWWHYLSNATCLIRPHLFYALCFV